MLGGSNDLLAIGPVHIPVILKDIIWCKIEHIHGDRHNILCDKLFDKSQVQMRICTVIWFSEKNDRTAVLRDIIENILSVIDKSFFKHCLDVISIINSFPDLFPAYPEFLAEICHHLFHKGAFKEPEMKSGNQKL